MHQPNDTGTGTHEINLTALIDVSLTLVVVLLLATPLAYESSLAVRGATSAAREGVQGADPRVELRVVSEDTVQVNRMRIARTGLEEVLPTLLDATPSRLVVVECAGSVSHGTFVNVLDQAKLSGAGEIAVVGR